VERKFWFYIEKELSDVVAKLQPILPFDESDRDYEDTWEWYETGAADTVDSGCYANLSREHDWEQGCYDCPVILIVRHPEMDIEAVGSWLAERLGVTVHYGEVHIDHRTGYQFRTILSWG
jgi:hypothetical protein